MLITPKNCIEIVLSRKTSNSKLRFYGNKVEGSLFWIAVISLAFGTLMAGIAYWWKPQWAVYWALGGLASCVFFTLAYQIAVAIPEFSKLRNIEREITNPMVAEFNGDIELINELAETFELHHLNLAKANFSRMSKHLRERSHI